MGKPGWEDDTWTPGRSSRGGRSENGDRAAGRSYDRDRMDRAGSRGSRGEPDPRGYDRSERHSSRSSSSRDDDWRGGSGGRSSSGGGSSRQGGSGYGSDRSRSSYGSSGSSGSSRGSSADDYGNYGSYRRSSSRDDYDARGGSGRSHRDPRGGGSGRDPRERRDGYGSNGGSGGGYGSRSGYDARDPRMGDRTMRGSSSARNRPPAGGGLWGDDTGMTGMGPRRPRPGAAVADPSGRGMAGRPGLNRLQQGDEELPEPKSGFTAGKAVLVVFLMLLLGAASGFIYFKISAPKVPPADIVPPTSGSTPATSSPAASPASTGTPKSFAPHGGVAGADQIVITITLPE